MQTIDPYGNLRQQRVYDYGSGSVSRTYSFSYAHDSDGNYATRYLRSLFSQAVVSYAGSGSPITLATNVYDGTATGPLTSARGFPQHGDSYDTTVTYRGNVSSSNRMGTITGYAYDMTGNAYKMVDGDGLAVSVASDTTASVPSLLTPNGNSNLATSLTYSQYLHRSR